MDFADERVTSDNFFGMSSKKTGNLKALPYATYHFSGTSNAIAVILAVPLIWKSDA